MDNLAQNNKEDSAEELEKLKKRLELRELKIRRLLLDKRRLLLTNRKLEKTLNDILSSRSWKLTKVLRDAFQKLRAISIFRTNHDIHLQPINGLIRQDDKYVVTNEDPYFHLSSNRRRMPQGWVQVTADVKAEKLPLEFDLYLDTGQGFKEDHTVLVTFEKEHDSKVLVRLPRGVISLRMDPFGRHKNFSIENLKFKELSRLTLAATVAAPKLRMLLKDPLSIPRALTRSWSIYKTGGLPALKAKLVPAHVSVGDYNYWIRLYDTLDANSRSKIVSKVYDMPVKPKISVVMPVYNVAEKWLRLAIESVTSQLYPNWELCIADDASPLPHIRKVLEEYSAKDERIKVSFRSENGHISAASNSALSLATSEWVCFLDHDDELSETALFVAAQYILENPSAKMFFSDEDKKNENGQRFNPYFKSGWNSDLMLGQNCVCHLALYKRDLLSKLGGFREGFEGAQDWDLTLRYSEAISSDEIVHIPYILYHWRAIESSTASLSIAKPYAMNSALKAVSEHLERIGEPAQVTNHNGLVHNRVKFPIPQTQPRVALIIPTHNQWELLKTCIDSITEKSTYQNYEIVVVDNRSNEKKSLDYLDNIQKDSRISVIRDGGEFNFSRINNEAVRATKSDIIGFVNNDIEVISKDWLSEMVSHAVRPNVGAVGAKLLYPNDTIQHGGILLGIGGVAGHAHKGFSATHAGHFCRLMLPQNFSAVTAACLLMKRDVFEEISGFDQVALTVAFNDVDLCLRIREKGYKIVWTPHAVLYHHESASRGYEDNPQKWARFVTETRYMKKRWKMELANDPYYNPNLTDIKEDLSLGFPPRVTPITELGS